MKGKIFVVVFVVMLMTSFGVTAADEIECAFEEKAWLNGYGCKIKSITSNLGGQSTFKGTHKADKNDNDVKILQYGGHSSTPRINLTRFDSIFCEKFLNLEEIHFSSLVPALIDQNALQNCNNLANFTLKRAEIRELPENFLPATLKKLDLTYNKLTTLPENFLKDVHQLEELNLGQNQINFLPQNIFKSLTKLRVLSLFHNNLESLNPAWFENLQNLEELYLGDNKISELPLGVFVPLINLKFSQLKNNQLTVIHADSFGVHNKLEWIQLFNNKLNAIDEKFLDILIASPKFGTGDDGGIDARWNECVDEEKIKNKAELKQKFKNCIENYQPRPQLPIWTQQNCGISQTVQGDIVGGTYIKPNSFPWHAALYKGKNYRCGGTLVTEQKVVTAAHCIQDKGESKALLPREVNVLLGAHNLSHQFEATRRHAAVWEIHMHDNWNPNDRRYDFDIAVIVLSDPVSFDRYVQPICLIPQQDSTIANSVASGYVVGYGYSEDVFPHEDVPRMLSMPITNYTECVKRFPLLSSVGSRRRTFCGGRADGSGVCAGDSGGGLIVEYGGAYYLRGIVSSSLKGGNQMCGENAYSIFSDILPYRKWINEIEVD